MGALPSVSWNQLLQFAWADARLGLGQGVPQLSKVRARSLLDRKAQPFAAFGLAVLSNYALNLRSTTVSLVVAATNVGRPEQEAVRNFSVLA